MHADQPARSGNRGPKYQAARETRELKEKLLADGEPQVRWCGSVPGRNPRSTQSI